MDKQEMISRLIENDSKAIRANSHWLESFMRPGFPSYSHLTDDELLAELGKRGIMAAPLFWPERPARQ